MKDWIKALSAWARALPYFVFWLLWVIMSYGWVFLGIFLAIWAFWYLLQ